jgi:hypothetical protein
MALEDKLLLCSSLAVFGCVLAAGYVAEDTSAHRARCHQFDTCPSDHATYRWGPHRVLVKPTSDKRNVTFKIRVRHAALTYFCKR